MPLIDIKLKPGRKDLIIFGVLWAAFFVALGRMAMWKPSALLVAAAVTCSAWVISLVFNRDFPRRSQLLGGLIPGSLLAIGGLENLGVPAAPIEYALWGVGAAGGLAAAFSPVLGRALYFGWMHAAVPLGWTFTHIILGAVYFGLFSPLGLVMRFSGYDPLSRRSFPSDVTHWLPCDPAPAPGRYFRQF